MLAAHGAKVVVNDLGGARRHRRATRRPAAEVVAEIKARRRGDRQRRRRATGPAPKRMIDQAVDTFGQLDVAGEQRRHPARPHAGQHDRGGVGRGHQGAPEGHLRAGALRGGLLARQPKAAGAGERGRIINTTSVSGIYGNVGQTNYGAAKAGIAAFTIIAARELRRYGVTVNAIAPRRADAHDRGPARVHRRAARRARPEMGVADGRLPGERGGATSPAASSRPASAGSPSARAGGAAPRRRRSPIRARPAGCSAPMLPKVRKNAGMDGLELD